MELVGVWSGRPGVLERLQTRLGGQFHFFGGDHPALFAQRVPDLLIIAPDATGLAGAGVIRPRVALLPGDGLALAQGVRATSAVSYGLGRQNTLTVSSMEEGNVAICLQRALMTLSGRNVERQEWVLPLTQEGQSLEEVLCLAGALLLLDQEL